MLTDDLLRAAYRETGLKYDMNDDQLRQARIFILATFDRLTPAGYLDPDGSFAEEEWAASADCEPVFRKPE